MKLGGFQISGCSADMAIKLYNTLSRSLEEFQPLDPPNVGVYGCGPTVYDYAHIGNYRSFLVYDLLHRYLEWSGFQVRFIVNLTDVDDRTIEAAARRGGSLPSGVGQEKVA